MSEDKKEEVAIEEGETLNQDEKIEEGETQEPKTYSDEDVKKIRRDYETGIGSLKSEKVRFEKAYKELPKIANDDARLVELYEEDPVLARQILEDHFSGQSIQEYKESIDYKEDYSDPAKMEAKIEREAKKLLEKKEAEKRAENNKVEKEAFIEKLKMEGEEKEAFEAELDDLLQVKKYQKQDITKVMERAYKLSAKDDGTQKLKNNEAIAKSMASTKGSKGAKPPKSVAERSTEYNKSFLRERGII